MVGAEDELGVLFREHGPSLVGLARRVVWNTQLAEEIVQDVFLAFCTGATGYDPERGSIRAFLATIVQRTAIDVMRSERSRRAREERDGRRSLPIADVAELSMRRHDHAAVRRALRALTDDERAAIVLAYFGGYSYREVARLLRVPEGTVKSRIRHGLQRLQLELATDIAA